jgi:uncharacterized protein with FMN-binding domain
VKRAPIVLSATAAGLALTLGFHAHAPVAPAIPTAQTTPSSSRSAPQASGSARAKPTTLTSAVVPNQYGNVQLQVTVANGKITSVQALQLPNGDSKSVEINTYAAPILQQSALTAQSANFNAVSGATYTSEGYKTALQSALDQARLPSSSSTAS